MAANWLPDGGAQSSFDNAGGYDPASRGLMRVNPSGSHLDISQGLVVVSQSGNARLVLSVDEQTSDARITFLTRLRNGALRLESAMRSKIDIERIECLVARREGNPLTRYSDIVANLAAHRSVLTNIETILLTGELGLQLKEELQRTRPEEGYREVMLAVAPNSGVIKEVGRLIRSTNLQTVGLRFSVNAREGADYVSHALLYSETDRIVRTCVIGACVIANTLQNACAFLGMKTPSV